MRVAERGRMEVGTVCTKTQQVRTINEKKKAW